MNPIKRDKTHCAVPQCHTTGWKHPEVSFFRFPRASSCKLYQDANPRKLRLRQEWIRILRIGKPISDRSVVCSKHFKESDFSKTGIKITRLRGNAVPSLCLPCSSKDNADKKLKKQSYVKERKKRSFTLSSYGSYLRSHKPTRMIEKNEVNKHSDADEIYQSAIHSPKSDKQNHKDEAGSSFATDDNSNDEIIVNTGHNKRKRKLNNSLSPKKVMNETEKSTSEISYDREDIFGQYVAGEMRALRDNPLLYLPTKQSILEILTSANFELINPE